MKKIFILPLIFLICLFTHLSYIHAQENQSFLNETNITSNETIINETIINETIFNETETNISEELNQTSEINQTESNETTESNQTYECLINEDCNDNNLLTIDLCINNTCSYELNETVYFNETESLNESLINDSDQYLNETNQTSKINPVFLMKLMSVLSPSYFLRMFTLGLQGYLMQGTTKEARILLTSFQPSTRNAFSATYSANIGFFENTIPANSTIINAYSIYPKLALNGSIIRFSISATNADNVWAKIFIPNGTIENLVLINNGDVYYTASSIGRYNVTFYANNSLGLTASALDYFDIYLPVSPHQPGGGEGEVECNYNWRCSPWDNCLNGEQTRACVNLGTCVGIEGKPEETRKCTDLLFDIILKLNNTELTEGDYLIFDVILKQKKDIENVDVQIRYFITDKDNVELFSQTETRAVENETIYSKTFDELFLNEGEYVLKAEVIYGNQQKANAEQHFNVIKEEIPIKKETPSILIYVIIISVLLVLLIATILREKKKKIIIHLKRKKKIKKITIERRHLTHR